MISRVEGEVVTVHEGGVELACGALCCRLLVPGCDLQDLAGRVGQTRTFHTLLYLEAQAQGAVLVPRLIGFATSEDRAFFELFTRVKGLGNRKALRALQLPFAAVARAIAHEDIDLLTSLPEIGRRTAQTIVAELQGKVDAFVELKPLPEDGRTSGGADPVILDAIAVLVQLGEPRAVAHQLVERALRADPAIDSADGLVAAAFRVKEG